MRETPKPGLVGVKVGGIEQKWRCCAGEGGLGEKLRQIVDENIASASSTAGELGGQCQLKKHPIIGKERIFRSFDPVGREKATRGFVKIVGRAGIRGSRLMADHEDRVAVAL